MFKRATLPDAPSLALAAFWIALALTLVVLLPPSPDDQQGASAVLWHGTTVEQLVLDAPNPCTNQPTALDASVRVQTAVISRDGAASVNVDASFDNADGATNSDRLIPIREQYSFAPDDPPDSVQPAHVHRVDVPLTDRLSGSHLSVQMVSSINPSGQVVVRLLGMRLVCDPLYNEPTLQEALP